MPLVKGGDGVGCVVVREDDMVVARVVAAEAPAQREGTRIDRALREVVEDPVGAEGDPVQDGVVHDHGDHDIALRGELGEGPATGAAILGQRLDRGGGDVVARHVEARPQQVAGHGQPHPSETGKANPSHV